MKFEVKLPNSYYKYADIDLESLDKINKRKTNISINLSSLIACKLEKLALNLNKPVQEILKLILIEEGVLDEDDLEFSNRKKISSKFLGVNCNQLKDIGTTKIYRVHLSEFAKAKVMKYLLDAGYDASFFFKKSLVKKAGKKQYEILNPSELGS
jgi:hypothetical protein